MSYTPTLYKGQYNVAYFKLEEVPDQHRIPFVTYMDNLYGPVLRPIGLSNPNDPWLDVPRGTIPYAVWSDYNNYFRDLYEKQYNESV